MTGSRIPLALQAVFLASNRGKEVDKPPPEKLAARTFFRSVLRRMQGKGKCKSKGKAGTETSPQSTVLRNR